MTATNLPVFEPAPVPLREPGELSVLRGDRPMPLPLESIAYRATVLDRIADVTLTQEFNNPYAEHLEATYTFPLAAGAAVRSFELTVAGRTIRAVVKERGQARQEYQQALDEGKRAALLEQERDNVFTIQVGNLPPGEKATVRISYCERLELSNERQVELRLPTVVAPRYVTGTDLGRSNSGTGVEDDTDAVGDASRVSPPRLAGKSSVNLDVEVMLSSPAGGIADLSCSQHATSTSFEGSAIRVELARDDEQPDRDVVLRWRLAIDEVKGSLSVYKSNESSYGMLTLVAPPALDRTAAHRDVVFLLDRSGSMQGIKMQSAIRACKQLLESLTPSDRFAVALFNTTISWMSSIERPFVPADLAGVSKGTSYLDSVTANGGTEIEQALAGVFDAISRRREEHEGRMPVVVLITDGEVANEHQVLERIQREIGDTRLFAVGIDTAVNDALLRRMAALGRGTAALVEPGAELERTLASVAREIGAPEVVDLEIEDIDAGVDQASVVPQRIPDLFSGRASTVFFSLEKAGTVRVRGKRADGSNWSQTVQASIEDVPAIANLWARGRVTELEDQFRIELGRKDEIRDKIIALSIEHAIVTRFTAMLAVDEQEVVNPDGSRRRVTQPVNMPAQWEMADRTSLMDAIPVAYSIPPPPSPMPTGAVMRSDSALESRAQFASPQPPRESKGFFEKLFQRGQEPQQPARPSDPAKLRAKLREIVIVMKGMLDGQVDDSVTLERLRVEARDLIGSDARLSALLDLLDKDLVGAMTVVRRSGFTVEANALIGSVKRALEVTWIKKLDSMIGDGGAFWETTV